jgi:hypothetical protein
MSAEPLPTAVADPGSETIECVERLSKTEGPAAAIEQLIADLDARGEYRALLDALLLKARFELKLPLIAPRSLSDLPEPARSQYEQKYVDAICLVGSRHIAAGDIPTAWAYYRAIGENEPVARAIREYQPPENDERLGAVIDVAFNQGVCPEHGFAMILEHYGTCPAITAFDQLPPHETAARSACARQLIERLHRDLAANLRGEIAGRGEGNLPEATPIAELVANRPWLFADEGYHIDVSHLAAVVRMAPLVTENAGLALAVDLTEYGRRLSPRLVFDGPPPFEKIFEDHGVYLKALLGREVNQAVDHFRAKFNDAGADGGDDDRDDVATAQMLVNILARAGRTDEAIEIASEHFAGIPEGALGCPGVTTLCVGAGQIERLARLARARGDLVTFTAALLASQLPK